MPLDAQALLDGPRGRRLCAEFALENTQRSESLMVQEARLAMFSAEREFDSGATQVLLTAGGSYGRQADLGRITPGEAATSLGRIPLGEPSPDSLRAALSRSVNAAMYWQEPDGRDGLLALPELRSALEPIAAVIAASPHIRWWSKGIEWSDQWAVPWDGRPTSVDDPRGVLERWREAAEHEELQAERERPQDPSARYSGTWWSKPPSGLTHTMRLLGDAGPAGLWFIEDDMAWKSATATPVLSESSRVLEIRGPQDWVDLCRRHPLAVTASRRHDWYRVTGWTLEWVQPDWAAVAAEWDGVHLSVAGYLTAATRLLELGDGVATVVAGWAPDETYWFTRTLVAGPPEQWRRDSSDNWYRVK